MRISWQSPVPIKVEQKSKVIPEVPKIEINCRGLFTISHQAPRVVKRGGFWRLQLRQLHPIWVNARHWSWNTFRLIAFGRSNAGILMSSGTLKSRAAPRAA
jgi:hypothetical protein